MKLENYSSEQLKKDILKIVGKYLDLKKHKIFFFGSRVKGDSFLRSDIDIGIEGSKNISADIKLEIEEDLNKLPILYNIDFIDFKKVSPKFKKEALKFKEIINNNTKI